MDRTKRMITRVLLPCFMVAVCATAAATVLAAERKTDDQGKASVTRWQHLAMTHDVKRGTAGELARRIVKLGRDGWELVTVENTSQAGTTTKTIFYFKKPL